MKHEKAYGWERRQPWLTEAFKEEPGLSLFVVGDGLYDPPASRQQLPKRRHGGATATDPGWRIHRGFCDVCDDGSNHMHGNPASAVWGSGETE